MCRAAFSCGFRSKCLNLRRLKREAPVQVDPPEAGCLLQECEAIVRENLGDRDSHIRSAEEDRNPDMTRVY